MSTVLDKEGMKLWRYMPLVSLIDFLQTGELRLTRADKFEDTMEENWGQSKNP